MIQRELNTFEMEATMGNQQYNIEQVLLDSDSSHSMPLATFLLNPSYRDDMARQRESLYDDALGLVARMTAVSYTSEILQLNFGPPSASFHPTISCQRRHYTKSWAELTGCWA